MKKICSIENCDVTNYGYGYCKRHYRSYKRHGNALTVDEIKHVKDSNVVKTRGKGLRTNVSTQGTCEVEGCEHAIKARRLCDKHLARLTRTGTTDDKESEKYKYLEFCIVEYCEREHYSFGYCNTHFKTFKETGTPYRPKIIKLCGVKNCTKPLQAKGLCMNHYAIWKKRIAFITE